MDSIPKFLASLIAIIVGVVLCVSLIISTVVVNSARTYHSSVIEEIEASGFDEVVIQKCIDAAERDNYALTVEKIENVETDPQFIYKVTLNYGVAAPIFGKVHIGSITGYALSGMFPVE